MHLPCPLGVLLSPPWPSAGHQLSPCQGSAPAGALSLGTEPSWGLGARTFLAGNSGLRITHSFGRMTECYLQPAQCPNRTGAAVMREAGDFCPQGGYR